MKRMPLHATLIRDDSNPLVGIRYAVWIPQEDGRQLGTATLTDQDVWLIVGANGREVGEFRQLLDGVRALVAAS